MTSAMRDKQRWVVNNVDTLTVETIKTLASTSKYSMGHVLDLAVEYFSRNVVFEKDNPFKWSLPEDM